LFAILSIKINKIGEIFIKNPSTALGIARVFMSPIAGLIHPVILKKIVKIL
jgi:hypothetical protein